MDRGGRGEEGMATALAFRACVLQITYVPTMGASTPRDQSWVCLCLYCLCNIAEAIKLCKVPLAHVNIYYSLLQQAFN